MYQVGEYVVYGQEGVCRVTEIGHPKLSGISKEQLYYTLAPQLRASVIYIPVNTEMYMRYPLSACEIQSLFSRLPELPLCSGLPADPRLIGQYYQGILTSHDAEMTLRLYKTIFCKQRSLSGTRKSLSVTDMRYWKQAEEQITSEAAYVLGLDVPQVLQMLRSCMEEPESAL